MSDETLGTVRDAIGKLITESAAIEQRAGSHAMLRAPAAGSGPIHVLSFDGDEARLMVHGDGLLRAYGASDDAAALEGVPDWAKAILVEAGNALAWIYERIQDVKRFVWKVAGDALEFLVEVAAETVKFVVKTIEGGLRAIDWLLEKVLGIDLSRLWQWLGFVFNWKEIDRLSGMLVKQVTDGCARIEREIPVLAKRVDDILSNIRDYVVRPSPSLLPASCDALVTKAHEEVAKKPALHEARSSPATNWLLDQILGSGFELRVDQFAPSFSDAPESAAKFKALWDAIEPRAEKLVGDLMALFEEGKFDLQAGLKLLVSEAAFGCFEVLRELVAKVFEALHENFAKLVEFFTKKVSIPLFSEIVGRDVSLLDIAALTVAAPTSIVHRLVTGKALLPEESSGRLLRAAAHPGYIYAEAATYATLVWDGLNVVAALSTLKKDPPVLALLTLDLVRFAANILRLFPTCPQGDAPQVRWQRYAWGSYMVAFGVEVVHWLYLGFGRKLKLDAADHTRLAHLRGAGIVVSANAAFVFECVASKYDYESKDKAFLEDAKLKVAQNFCYWLADTSSGGLGLAGDVGKRWVILAGGFSGVMALAAFGFNLGRMLRSQ